MNEHPFYRGVDRPLGSIAAERESPRLPACVVARLPRAVIDCRRMPRGWWEEATRDGRLGSTPEEQVTHLRLYQTSKELVGHAALALGVVSQRPRTQRQPTPPA